jgi:hypothetical protein
MPTTSMIHAVWSIFVTCWPGSPSRHVTKRKSSAKSSSCGERKSATSLNALELSRVDLSKTLQESGITRKVSVRARLYARKSDLMQRMQANRTQMALVIDEYGGTDGLVSLEDIVEMVVGDIADEHDDEEETLISKDRRRHLDRRRQGGA